MNTPLSTPSPVWSPTRWAVVSVLFAAVLVGGARGLTRWPSLSSPTPPGLPQLQLALGQAKPFSAIDPLVPDPTLFALDDPHGFSGSAARALPQVSNPQSQRRVQGVVETYFAGNSFGPSYPGLNFAISTSPNDRIELIFAGQTTAGSNGPERFEASTHVRAGLRHRLGISLGAVSFRAPTWISTGDNQPSSASARPGQFSVRAIDEWIVRDGIVVVLGLDYSKFIGAGGAHSLDPRIGIQYDANARTRLRAAYAPGGDEGDIQSVAAFEGAQVAFRNSGRRPVAYVDGRAIMDRSHRLEFGIERVLDNKSNLEGAAFFDTTLGRGVGLLSTPMTAFSGATGEAFINVANQQGASRGMRMVYTRRLSRIWTASGGYSFGRGQRLAPGNISQPAEIFENGFFQTAALQLGADFGPSQ